MPMKRERYPANWDEISMSIRKRAGFKCEQCGAPNGKDIVRSSIDPVRYIVLDEEIWGYRTPDGNPIRLSEIPDGFDGKHTRVILTVHHIGIDREDGTAGDPHDKMDVRDNNLICLCQRCHLIADMPHHVANAKATRHRKQAEQLQAIGQLALFGEE